jgi:hypothetical protein
MIEPPTEFFSVESSSFESDDSSYIPKGKVSNKTLKKLRKTVGTAVVRSKKDNRYCHLSVQFPKGEIVDAICDTGCTNDGVIDPDMVSRLGLTNQMIPCKSEVELANGSLSRTFGRLKIMLRAGNLFREVELEVTKVPYGLIIGKTSLNKFSILQKFEEDVAKLNNVLTPKN